MATNCLVVDGALVARDILVLLPGATQALVELELFNAVREFCEKSLSVRADSQDILPAGASELVLADTPDGLEVIKVLWLRGPNGPIYPSNWVRRVPVNTSGAALRFCCPERNRLLFDAAVTQDTALDAVVAVKPPRQCVKLPAAVYNEHYEAIKAGTLGRLYGHTSKAYTNLVLAGRFMARATALTAQAKFTAEQENTMGDPGWRFPRYGG